MLCKKYYMIHFNTHLRTFRVPCLLSLNRLVHLLKKGIVKLLENKNNSPTMVTPSRNVLIAPSRCDTLVASNGSNVTPSNDQHCWPSCFGAHKMARSALAPNAAQTPCSKSNGIVTSVDGAIVEPVTSET